MESFKWKSLPFSMLLNYCADKSIDNNDVTNVHDMHNIEEFTNLFAGSNNTLDEYNEYFVENIDFDKSINLDESICINIDTLNSETFDNISNIDTDTDYDFSSYLENSEPINNESERHHKNTKLLKNDDIQKKYKNIDNDTFMCVEGAGFWIIDKNNNKTLVNNTIINKTLALEHVLQSNKKFGTFDNPAIPCIYYNKGKCIHGHYCKFIHLIVK